MVVVDALAVVVVVLVILWCWVALCSQDKTLHQTTPPTTRVRPFPEIVGYASIIPLGSRGCVWHPNGSRDIV